MATGAAGRVVGQIDHGEIAGEERLPLDGLRLLADDVHGGGVDQGVAGAAGDGDVTRGIGEETLRRVTGQKPECWP